MKIPPLIYGTAWKKERTAALVEKAVLYGFRGIDTACQPKHYNEEGVGQALKRLNNLGIERKKLFIQTKFTPLSGQDPFNVPYDSYACLKEQVQQSFQASLKNLGVDYVDALLIHSPLSKLDQTMQVWHEMEALHAKGRVDHLGISNCYELNTFKKIYEEATIKPVILQNRFYTETDYDKALRSFCTAKNIHYQSFWTLTANPNILKSPVLAEIARAKLVTVEQLFFRYLIELKIIPLIGTCSDIHMQEDLAIFEFNLTHAEIKRIDSII